MDDDAVDTNAALLVDGNAIAGQLAMIFGREMTTAVAKCASCTNHAQVGALMVYMRGPGIVLRCPTCTASVARIVETPEAIYLDARGAAYIRMNPAG